MKYPLFSRLLIPRPIHDRVNYDNTLEMAEEEARRGSDEMKRRRDEWLKTGSDPLARWWRSLAKPAPKEDCASLVMREEPPAE